MLTILRGSIVFSLRHLTLVCACIVFVACSLNPHPLPPEQVGSTEDASTGATADSGTYSGGGDASVDAHVDATAIPGDSGEGADAMPDTPAGDAGDGGDARSDAGEAGP